MELVRLATRRLHTSSCLFSSQNNNKSAKNIIEFLSNRDHHTPVNNKKITNSPLWQRHKDTVKKKLHEERWNPPKKLSKDSMENVRLLKRQFPKLTSTDLSKHFKISPDAIRRILKSNWQPTEEESENVQRRWKARGERIQSMYDNNEINTDSNDLPVDRKIILNYNSRQKFMELTKVVKTKKSKKNIIESNKNKLHLLKDVKNSS